MRIETDKARIAEIRKLIRDEDSIHNMSTTDWVVLTKELLTLADEYVWLREESES